MIKQLKNVISSIQETTATYNRSFKRAIKHLTTNPTKEAIIAFKAAVMVFVAAPICFIILMIITIMAILIGILQAITVIKKRISINLRK